MRNGGRGRPLNSVVSWLRHVTRYPLGVSAAFGIGAVVAAVPYSIISVVYFLSPAALGLGKRQTVVLEMAIDVVASVASAVAFGILLALLPFPSETSQRQNPRIVALVFGLIAFFLARGTAEEIPDVGWLVFIIVGLVSAVAYRYGYFRAQHEAS
jgi:hypothetical protein